MARNKRKWTSPLTPADGGDRAEMIAEAIRGAQAGLRTMEIAKVLGVSYGAVYYWLGKAREEGVKIDPPRKRAIDWGAVKAQLRKRT